MDKQATFSKLPETIWRERHFIQFVLISFHSRDVFCTLFVRPGFHLFCARLPVQYLAVYSVLESLIKQTLTATATNAVAE